MNIATKQLSIELQPTEIPKKRRMTEIMKENFRVAVAQAYSQIEKLYVNALDKMSGHTPYAQYHKGQRDALHTVLKILEKEFKIRRR